MNRGWALTLGVFLGFQVARLQDKMPFVVDSVMRIRSMMESATWHVDEDVFEDEDEDVDDE